MPDRSHERTESEEVTHLFVDRDKGKSFDRADLEARTKDDLQRLLEGEGLKKSGNKAELVDRLEAFYQISHNYKLVEKFKPILPICPTCGEEKFDGERPWSYGITHPSSHDCVCPPEPSFPDGFRVVVEKPIAAVEDKQGNCLHSRKDLVHEVGSVYFCGRCETRIERDSL